MGLGCCLLSRIDGIVVSQGLGNTNADASNCTCLPGTRKIGDECVQCNTEFDGTCPGTDLAATPKANYFGVQVRHIQNMPQPSFG